MSSSEHHSANSAGDYWSNTLCPNWPRDVWGIGFDSDPGDCGTSSAWREVGQSVRPVRSASKN